MTNEEILIKAIEKAGVNGWRNHTRWYDSFFTSKDCVLSPVIIFSHSFAKAFWGEKTVRMDGEPVLQDNSTYLLKIWQHHLQQMVLEEDPIKYLEEFI